MEFKVFDTYEEMSEYAADEMAKELKKKSGAVMGLATGSTPLGLYANLAKKYQTGELDFSDVISFNLDEYYPICADDPQSYIRFMKENLFSKINIKPENINIPNGEAKDVRLECERYEAKIKSAGGIDIQILGVGENGHIGFNEPDAVLSEKTHLVTLTESTICANARFFESKQEVPKTALTMGMGTIFSAKKIILIISGAKKRAAVRELLNGEIKTDMPASLLKLHKNVLCLCDKEAYGI